MAVETRVPVAVREQAEAADKLLEKEAAAEKSLETPAPESSDVTSAPKEQPPVQQDDNTKLRGQLATSEQRYNTLRGKYNAEIGGVNTTIRDLQSQIQEFRQKAPVVPEKPQEPAGLTHLNEEERERYDKDSLDLQSRVALGVAEREVEKLRAERKVIENRVTLLEESRQTNQTSDLWNKVEKLCPGANDINDSDSEFFEFLNQIEPLSGASYREIGVSATNVGDVKRLADLVNAYKAATGKEVALNDNKRVLSQQKPGNSKVITPVTAQPKKRVVPASEINSFYQDKALSHLKVSAKEGNELEQEYDEAERENRVDYSR